MSNKLWNEKLFQYCNILCDTGYIFSNLIWPNGKEISLTDIFNLVVPRALKTNYLCCAVCLWNSLQTETS